jgi:hypothetical protein
MTPEIVPPKVIEKLVDQIRRGECILFLGAGVHAPPPEDSPYRYPEEKRPPLGGTLALQLSQDCEFENILPQDSPYDLQRVSLCYETTRGLGRKALVDALGAQLREGREPSPALHLLAALPFRIVVTTNYDQLFERALAGAGKEPVRLVYDPTPGRAARDVASDPTPERPLLFKIHGDLDHRESIVITDEDYIGFVQRMSEKEQTHPVPETVRYRMRKWPLLFVGYSLRDYNLRLLFRTLRWQVDPADAPISYSVDHQPDPLILRVWQDERHFVTFLTLNLWAFVPELHRAVQGGVISADEATG